jgi:hypothetical protein
MENDNLRHRRIRPLAEKMQNVRFRIFIFKLCVVIFNFAFLILNFKRFPLDIELL